jgi:hypothetical protein
MAGEAANDTVVSVSNGFAKDASGAHKINTANIKIIVPLLSPTLAFPLSGEGTIFLQ